MTVEVLINTLILGLSVLVLWRGGGEIELVSVIIVTQFLSALLCFFLVWRSRLLAPPQESAPASARTDPVDAALLGLVAE